MTIFVGSTFGGMICHTPFVILIWIPFMIKINGEILYWNWNLDLEPSITQMVYLLQFEILRIQSSNSDLQKKSSDLIISNSDLKLIFCNSTMVTEGSLYPKKGAHKIKSTTISQSNFYDSINFNAPFSYKLMLMSSTLDLKL